VKITQNRPDYSWKKDLNPDLITLSETLKSAQRLVILGVGSELMQDDKAGPDITTALEKKYGHSHPRVRIFTGYTTPENFTRDIADFKPDHVILVDAADLNLPAGTLSDLPIDRITDFSLGTHKLSLVMMIKFLSDTIQPDFSVLAIQYKSILYGEAMTREMKAAVKKAICYFTEIIDAM
jgi:hydrogenase 3 maturation protease